MEQNKSLNEQQEQVLIYPNPRRIEINHTQPARAYGLFDSETGTQVSDFKKGTDGQVEFQNLDPTRHYDVGVIENPGDKKPQFAINWTHSMKDDTDAILNNSGNLPVVYPQTYLIKYNKNNSDNVFELTDKDNNPVGQVINVAQTGDKPEFRLIWSLKVKDDTQK